MHQRAFKWREIGKHLSGETFFAEEIPTPLLSPSSPTSPSSSSLLSSSLPSPPSSSPPHHGETFKGSGNIFLLGGDGNPLLASSYTTLAVQVHYIQGGFLTGVEDCKIHNKKVNFGLTFPFLLRDFAIFNTLGGTSKKKTCRYITIADTKPLVPNTCGYITYIDT